MNELIVNFFFLIGAKMAEKREIKNQETENQEIKKRVEKKSFSCWFSYCLGHQSFYKFRDPKYFRFSYEFIVNESILFFVSTRTLRLLVLLLPFETFGSTYTHG